MTENSDKQDDIFDNIDSDDSGIEDNFEKHRKMQNNELDFQNDKKTHQRRRSKGFIQSFHLNREFN